MFPSSTRSTSNVLTTPTPQKPVTRLVKRRMRKPMLNPTEPLDSSLNDTMIHSRIPKFNHVSHSTPKPSSLSSNFDQFRKNRGLFSATKNLLAKKELRERIGQAQRVIPGAPSKSTETPVFANSPEFGTPAISTGGSLFAGISTPGGLCHDVFGAGNDALEGLFSPILGRDAKRNAGSSWCTTNETPFTGLVARSPNVFDASVSGYQSSLLSSNATGGSNSFGSIASQPTNSFSVFDNTTQSSGFPAEGGFGSGLSAQSNFSLEEQRWQHCNGVNQPQNTGFGSASAGGTSSTFTFGDGGFTAAQSNPSTFSNSFFPGIMQSSESAMGFSNPFAAQPLQSSATTSTPEFSFSNPFASAQQPLQPAQSTNPTFTFGNPFESQSTSTTKFFQPVNNDHSDAFGFASSTDSEESPITPHSALNTAFAVFEDTPPKAPQKAPQREDQPTFVFGQCAPVNAPAFEPQRGESSTQHVQNQSNAFTNTQANTSTFFQQNETQPAMTFGNPFAQTSSSGTSFFQPPSEPTTAFRMESSTTQNSIASTFFESNNTFSFGFAQSTNNIVEQSQQSQDKENLTPFTMHPFPENRSMREYHTDPYNSNHLLQEHLKQLSSFQSPKPVSKSLKMPVPTLRGSVLCERPRTDTKMPSLLSRMKRKREDVPPKRTVSFTAGVRTSSTSYQATDLDSIVSSYSMQLSTDYAKIYRVSENPVVAHAAAAQQADVVRPMVVRRVAVPPKRML